tara:strand:- start:91 stop:1191 length:1101 start_codon:yes stop_codon:yes gene_type:complete
MLKVLINNIMNITIDQSVKNIISSLKKKFRSEDIKTFTKGALASTSRRKIIVVYTENDPKTVKGLINDYFTDNAVMFTNLDKKTPLSSIGHFVIEYPGTVTTTIAIVVKPLDKGRVATGKITQTKFANYLVENFDAKIVGMAAVGQQIPDVSAEIEKNKTVKVENFEIKGTENFRNPIGTFDKTVSRSGSGVVSRVDDAPINEIAKVIAKDKKVNLPRNIPSTSSALTLLVDAFRTEDKTIGFAGDPGVTATSGKFPRDKFTVTSSTSKEKIIQIIKDHFVEGKDNYFTIFNSKTDEFLLFRTGYGTYQLNESDIKNKILPFNSNAFEFVGLATYGTPSGTKKVRASVVVKLNPMVQTKTIKYEIA